VNIDEEGNYILNAKHVFNLQDIVIFENSIKFSKVDFENKIHSNETLMIVKDGLITGKNNKSISLEYVKL